MKKWMFLSLILCSVSIFAKSISVPMYTVTSASSGHGAFVGRVEFKDTPYGLLIQPHLKSLTPGMHGFHIHQMSSCVNMGMAAGGHLDPANTGKHLGPYTNSGHLGDLPALWVDKAGKAALPIVAPRLRVSDLEGHTLMVHMGPDNYADKPLPLGGGGARVACGVIGSPR